MENIKLITVFVSAFLYFTQMLYAFEWTKCEDIFLPLPTDKIVDKSIEEYSFQFSKVFSIYYGMHAAFEEKCPALIDDLYHLKKDNFYLLNFFQNQDQ